MPRLDSATIALSRHRREFSRAPDAGASGSHPADAGLGVDQAWVLKRINFLRAAPKSAIEDLTARRTCLNLRPRELVFKPDDRGDAVYLVETGRIRLSHFADSGREIVVAILDTGEFFGEEPRGQETVRSFSALALEDSRLWRLARTDFEKTLADHGWLAHSVARHLHQRLLDRDPDTETEETPTEGSCRLARALLALAERRGDYDEAGRAWLGAPLTAVELAWMAELDRETLLATLQDFEARGWIQRHASSIGLTDVAGLRAHAGDST